MSTGSSQPSQDQWLHQVIDNRYRILERIGRGGMGTVYKVEHTQMGKIAAVKLLHANLANDKDLIKRFHREATAISRLNHPNIVQVFDFGRVRNSVYLVMEFLKGEDLCRILMRDGPLDVERCVPILCQVCDALAEAHGLNIIHRDLKPENVRVSRTLDGNDFIKVLDFGLAKIVEEEEEQAGSITARGSLVGTPYYMAPEMIRGRAMDHRVDIYSMGALAYRMLTAQNAFVAKTPIGVLTKHISEELSPPSTRVPEANIPPLMDAVVIKAMAKDPKERYQSAQALKKDLIQVQKQLLRQDSSLIRIGPHPSGGAEVGQQRRHSDSQTAIEDRAVVKRLPTGQYLAVPALALSKEDLAFEKKLRRGRYLNWLLPIPIIAAVAFAVYWFGMREVKEFAPLQEVEPNNELKHATLVSRAKPIRGKVGKRLSSTQSDFDWYKLHIKSPTPQSLLLRVTGVPNMDTTLELYDAAGGRVARADSTGKGLGEVITNRVVDPGFYFVLVREVWIQGTPPSENSTDTYTLSVAWEPRGERWELEPNQTPKDALSIKPGASVRGYLGEVTDQDLYKVEGDKGKLAGLITGVDGVDLVLEVTRDGGKKVVVDKESISAGEEFHGVRISPKRPVLIRVRRKNNKKLQHRVQTKGLEKTYSLKTWIVPGK